MIIYHDLYLFLSNSQSKNNSPDHDIFSSSTYKPNKNDNDKFVDRQMNEHDHVENNFHHDNNYDQQQQRNQNLQHQQQQRNQNLHHRHQHQQNLHHDDHDQKTKNKLSTKVNIVTPDTMITSNENISPLYHDNIHGIESLTMKERPLLHNPKVSEKDPKLIYYKKERYIKSKNKYH